jgi:hypothetical protein
MEKNEFIQNEEIALKQAFQECREKGKLFNLNKWKAKRENDRLKFNNLAL